MTHRCPSSSSVAKESSMAAGMAKEVLAVSAKTCSIRLENTAPSATHTPRVLRPNGARDARQRKRAPPPLPTHMTPRAAPRRADGSCRRAGCPRPAGPPRPESQRPQGKGQCLSRNGSGNTRQRQSLSREDSGSTRQRQCFCHEDRGSVLAAKAVEMQRKGQCLSRDGSGTHKGTGQCLTRSR